MVEIKTENMPKELREIHDPITFGAFLRDVYARTSSLNNGDVYLDIAHRIRGGMVESPDSTAAVTTGNEQVVEELSITDREGTVLRNVKFTYSDGGNGCALQNHFESATGRWSVVETRNLPKILREIRDPHTFSDFVQKVRSGEIRLRIEEFNSVVRMNKKPLLLPKI